MDATPPPGGSAIGEPVAAPPGLGGPPTSDERLWALFAHLAAPAVTAFTGLLGFVGPLVLYLLKKGESRFVAFHALQALYFELGMLLLAPFTCGLSLLVGMVFHVLAAARAHAGERWEYPLVGKLAREKVLGA